MHLITLTEAACAVLQAAAPDDKVALTYHAAAAWRDGQIREIGATRPPLYPARPERPIIQPANTMKRRGIGGGKARMALIHALAHIEFNAIDLAWDLIARFADPILPRAFYDDWVTVALEEADHFMELRRQMQAMGGDYGDCPAHSGLWDAAVKTADDFLARLALVPMTLEARALDTAPNTIARLDPIADHDSIAGLSQVVADEIGHVAAGVRWFEFLCSQKNQDPITTYQDYIQPHFPKGLKPPFNHAARAQAGLRPAYYDFTPIRTMFSMTSG